MKLHIGGKQVKDGWTILDIQAGDGVDFVGDINDLNQFADESIERFMPVTFSNMSRNLIFSLRSKAYSECYEKGANFMSQYLTWMFSVALSWTQNERRNKNIMS